MKKYLTTKRFIDYGFKIGFFKSGRKKSISDVSNVKVGHVTKIQGKSVRTGLTLIDPGIPNLFRNKIPAAIYVANGYGKLSGHTQVEELGTIESPIVLTNTLAVGTAMQGVIDLVIKNTPDLEAYETINAVVGEINDGRINTIHTNVITPLDVEKAYLARTNDFQVGNVGGGTGSRAFSWKGGVGTASRVVPLKKNYTVGILVQTNYGGSLRMLGVPIGEILGADDYHNPSPEKPDGSCIVTLATDAPLTARQLKRLAVRAFFGIVRTGGIAAHASGDYVIAFSTNRTGVEGSGQIGKCLLDSELTPLFFAAADAVEEAVYDALFAAETMKGRDGNILRALPKNKVLTILHDHNYHEKE